MGPNRWYLGQMPYETIPSMQEKDQEIKILDITTNG